MTVTNYFGSKNAQNKIAIFYRINSKLNVYNLIQQSNEQSQAD